MGVLSQLYNVNEPSNQMTDKTNLMFFKLTLLFLLPAVVPEVRNIVFFYISLNIL